MSEPEWKEHRVFIKGHRRIFVYHMYPTIEKTNLIYHVCPLKENDIWRKNLTQLKARWGIFNGRKVFAVSQDEKLTHSIEEVVRELNRDAEFIAVKNDIKLRETVSFTTLLKQVESINSKEMSFYAHSKGNSTAENRLGSEYWRNAMYSTLLDGIEAVRDQIQHYFAIGTHKMTWPAGIRSPYPSGLQNKFRWMFAGTFFWFRHDAIFGNKNCYDIKMDRYGTEAWLGDLFPSEQGGTLFQPFPANTYPGNNPYDPTIYSYPIRDL